VQRGTIKSLNKIRNDRGTRRAVKEDYLVHDDTTVHDHLVDIGAPGRIGSIAEFHVEGKIAAPARQTGRSVEPGVGPCLYPLTQIEMVELVGRD